MEDFPIYKGVERNQYRSFAFLDVEINVVGKHRTMVNEQGNKEYRNSMQVRRRVHSNVILFGVNGKENETMRQKEKTNEGIISDYPKSQFKISML